MSYKDSPGGIRTHAPRIMRPVRLGAPLGTPGTTSSHLGSTRPRATPSSARSAVQPLSLPCHPEPEPHRGWLAFWASAGLLIWISAIALILRHADTIDAWGR